jgi:CheY-like chemotaxis protein
LLEEETESRADHFTLLRQFSMRSEKPILLVEDDQVDVMTIERALKQVKVLNPLFIAGNGEEALTHLQDSRHQIPCIILLDLNMPRMNGLEFLAIIKANEQLRTIPVIILTTSKLERDRVESFNLGVAGYMIKPVDYLQFLEVVRTIDLYWTLSQLPE